MSSSDSDSENKIPQNVIQKASKAKNNLLPKLSKERYEETYQQFIKWKAEEKIKSATDENVLLAYFQDLSEKYAPSSLWVFHSMLKTKINTDENINIKKFLQLTAFLKQKSRSYKSKKSNVFTSEEVKKFLTEAPNEIHLATKVIAIFGIYDACRSIEIMNVKVNDVKKQGQIYVVDIPVTKTKVSRKFMVNKTFSCMVEKYISLRSPKATTDRFFMNYQDGKCTNQVIGKNKIANLPKLIAIYLNLPNPASYTGHAFHRTSATLLADAGASMSMLKRHSAWKSNSMVSGYIEDSDNGREKISNMLTSEIDPTEISIYEATKRMKKTTEEEISVNTTVQETAQLSKDTSLQETHSPQNQVANTQSNTIINLAQTTSSNNQPFSMPPITFENNTNCTITIKFNYNK